MSDRKKTKKQLVEELQLLRQRLTAVESRASLPARETGSPAEAEEKFQVIFDKSLDATLIIDGASGKILAALEQAEGSRTRAARLLGMSRATFYRRLEKLKIKPFTTNDSEA